MENLIILPQRKISRFVQIIGFIFFSVLFYISWRFYLERILSFDGAFYVFRFMESGTPFPGPGRYSDYLPEFLPFIAFKTGATLNTILILYSVSFIVLHYLIFLVTTLILKNNGAGIAIMLVSCLAYYHSFYAPLMQLNESIIAAVLVWALIHPETPNYSIREKRIYAASAVAVVVYMSFLHPLGIILLVFVFGLEMIGAKRYNDRYLWVISIIGVGWLLLKSNVFFKQQYDQDQVISLHAMIANLKDWQTWPSTHYVSEYVSLHFRSLKWLAIICLFFSLRKGLLLFLFLLLYIAGFTFILLANYQKGTSPITYESYCVIYGFFVGLTFIFLFYHPERKNFILLLTIPLLWTSVKKIYTAHNIYSDRLSYVGRTVKSAHDKGIQKCIIDSKCYPYDYAFTPWNFAFETLLYSSLPGTDSSVTIFIKEPRFNKVCDSAQNLKNVLFGVQFSPLWFTSNDMPDNYFRLPSSGYKYLTHSQDDSSFHEDIFSGQNIKIVPLKQNIHIYVNDDVASIPLEVINTSGHIIPAIPRAKNPILVSYKFLDDRGKILFSGGTSVLETDAGSKSSLGMSFYIPRLKGTYFIRPDIITEGVRWWNIPVEPVKVIID
jgi:hypothetical protein